MSYNGAARDQQDVRAAIARGELEELRGVAFFNRTSIVSERFCAVGDGVDSLEGHLHSLWHMYYQLARHTSHDTPAHDSLALDILRVRGLGTLTRPAQGVYGTDVARTTQGTLWDDVPFLVTDMVGFWGADNCAPLSGSQRLNFASFLAKLASTRIAQDGLCQVALVVLRAALEEERELGSAAGRQVGDDGEDAMRDGKALDIAHLLPLACAWITEAGHVLMQLSEASWSHCAAAIGRGGGLLVGSELGRQCTHGFTPWRWMFWLKRLHEIRDKAKEASEKQLEEYAVDAIERMVANVRERNSSILRVYKAAGDMLQRDEHLSCLKDASRDD